MNFRTTVFLLALLLVAGTLALVIHYRQEHQSIETKDEHKLVDLEEKDLAKVIVTPSGGKRMVLEKSGTEWKLSEPINAPADTFAVDSLVSGLINLKMRDQVDETYQLGMSNPLATVELYGVGDKSYKMYVLQRSVVGNNSTSPTRASGRIGCSSRRISSSSRSASQI